MGRERYAPARRPTKRWPWQRSTGRAQATRRSAASAVSSSRPRMFFQWLRTTSIALVSTCGALYAGYYGYDAFLAVSEEFPIKTVRTYGELTHIQPEHMREVLGQSLRENFFVLDLEQTRERIEAQPWVHQATLRKEWPDTLIVHLEERQPIALWGHDQVLGNDMALFGRGEVESLPAMPHLIGADRHARLMWDRFQALNGMLTPATLGLKQLVMAERYSWKLVLENGMEIVVDENRWREKMDRFVQFYQKIPESERSLVARVDLRYDNALAVKWKKKDDNPDAA